MKGLKGHLAPGLSVSEDCTSAEAVNHFSYVLSGPYYYYYC